ncbi:uncharacterized protein V6R79_026176 [Siganus canaliculatus]
MAPSTTTTDAPVSPLSTRDRHKLRKPLVEKMRRDRINTCIEQLKVLLEKEFHRQDPNGKLEKADVLEMTVVFLKQQLQPQRWAPQTAHSHGYSHCWKETLSFLSEATLPELRDGASSPASSSSSSSHCHVQAAEKQQVDSHRAMWRPW